MISVLVADDSFFMRKLISDILSADPEISIVGIASDGEQAVAMASKLQPDVITMDLDMPKLNGLDATKRIMSESGPRPIVVMLSAYTKEKANETLECMRAGAFGCVLKPSGPISINIEKVEHELIAQIKAAARSHKDALQRPLLQRSPASSKMRHPQRDAFPLIIIGASTGGPPVLEEIFAGMEHHVDAAVLVVQHMPEKFTASLAERLDKISPLKVKQADEGEIVKSGIALVAPGDMHMRIQKKTENGRIEYVIRLSKDAPVKGLRPSIDILLDSVAQTFPGKMLAVILTGMGEDGSKGVRVLHDKGAVIIAQDPQTCVVDSMSQAVIDAGCADEILDPAAIAKRIVSFAASDS